MKASNAISSRTGHPAELQRNAASSSSTAERFELNGPSIVLDQRIHAFRRDIADVDLAGELFAPHYARPLTMSCGLIAAPVRDAPSDSALMVSELLPGEDFAVLDMNGGWAWGYCRADKRVGYVEMIELVAAVEPTHIVVEATAPIEAGADPLTPTLSSLPMGSRVRGEERGGVLAIAEGFIPLSHLRPVGEHEEDPLSAAQRLLGAPYLPGGRTIHGIDCAALVQLSLSLAGIPTPRDVDHQRLLGEPLPDGSRLERGDLVFCDDHVGMMLDDLMVIHVGPESGKVSVEPLKAVRPLDSCPALERRRLRR